MTAENAEAPRPIHRNVPVLKLIIQTVNGDP